VTDSKRLTTFCYLFRNYSDAHYCRFSGTNYIFLARWSSRTKVSTKKKFLLALQNCGDITRYIRRGSTESVSRLKKGDYRYYLDRFPIIQVILDDKTAHEIYQLTRSPFTYASTTAGVLPLTCTRKTSARLPISIRPLSVNPTTAAGFDVTVANAFGKGHESRW
jgi:hypothetical protein